MTVAYGTQAVLRDLDLSVNAHEVVAVLGPSGCGKTTLLHAVAGFAALSGGEVRLAGQRVSDPSGGIPPERRDIGMVFQHYALWPHLTALQIVAYPLRRRRETKPDAERQALALLDRLEIADLAGRRPTELSGGQQQRVGLARALARDAGLYLFDEPTAHLDTALRGVFAEELAARVAGTGAAALYATHDASEALAVADRVALLRAGRVLQYATPAEVYERPADLWAARMTGPASVLVTPVEAGQTGWQARIAGETVGVAGAATVVASPKTAVLVRPEWACLGGQLPGTVERLSYRGAHTDYRLSTRAGTVIVRDPAPPRARRGEAVRWSLHRGWIIEGDAGNPTPGTEPSSDA